jgi:ABC-type phosphate/phosphonate transport system ATPase subunit
MQPGKRRLVITFDAVNKRFPNGTTAVHELSLTVPEGGITVLVGSSGQHVVPLITDRAADSTVRRALARLGAILTTRTSRS